RSARRRSMPARRRCWPRRRATVTPSSGPDPVAATRGTMPTMRTPAAPAEPDTRYAWLRLAVVLALMTIGSGAMYVIAVVLPAVQAEFGVARADASLPYTLMLVGFGIGGIAMGRLADRCGVMVPVLIGAAGLA